MGGTLAGRNEENNTFLVLKGEEVLSECGRKHP